MPPLTIQDAFQLALGQFQAGRRAEAEATCRWILAEGAPNHMETQGLLGLVLGWTGEPPPGDLSLPLAELHFRRGVALEALGRTQEAAAACHRAAAMAPERPEFGRARDALVRALGGPERLRHCPPASCQIAALPEIYRELFGYRGDGTFVEIGALDGETHSNTSFLADLGWTGWYVEPVPEFAEACRARHRFNRVQVVNAAVGAEPGRAGISLAGGSSSLARHHVEAFVRLTDGRSLHALNRVHEVEVITPRDLFARIGWRDFDLLNLDVEGYEWPILSVWDFQAFRPRVAIVETRDQSPEYGDAIVEESRQVIGKFLDNGYRIHWRDEVNIVFVG